MDIEYLLLLQNFRLAINDFLTPFMEWISHFSVSYLFFLPAFIYWCIDEKKGLKAILAWSLAVTMTALIKLTACINRPWIRDVRIEPAGDAKTEATGYSFPSGHTATGAPIMGSLGYDFRENKFIYIFCIIYILLLGFSRNYLGVHTPQDVLVALFLGALSIYLSNKLFDYLEKKPEKLNYFIIFGILFTISGLVYITIKPYPLLYVDGKLLVDPEKMMNDGYGDIGQLLGLCIAVFLERNFIHHKASGLNRNGIIVSLLGLVFLYLIRAYVKPLLIGSFGDHFGRLYTQCVFILFIVTIWPLAIRLVKKLEEKTETETSEKTQD